MKVKVHSTDSSHTNSQMADGDPLMLQALTGHFLYTTYKTDFAFRRFNLSINVILY